MIKELLISNQFAPLGLDEPPRFTWKVEADHENAFQTGFRIVVAKCVRTADETVWDSGFVPSAESVCVPYDGPALEPCTPYQVQATVTDSAGQVHEGTASFETGLFAGTEAAPRIESGRIVHGAASADWHAKWITASEELCEESCPVFEKEIAIPFAVAKARLYVTALGLYEAAVDGRKAGSRFFAPGFTSYNHAVQYQTCDVTEQVRAAKDGAVTLSITAANGWYAGYLNGDGSRHLYGDRPAILAELHLTAADGQEQTVGTDGSWTVRTGQIRSSEIYMGETQDLTKDLRLRREQAQVFDGDTLPSAAEKPLVDPGNGDHRWIVAQQDEGVFVQQRIPVKEVLITPAGELVLDFGQNMAGLVEVTLPALAEPCKLVLQHGEALDAAGNFYNTNLRTARSEDVFIADASSAGKTVMAHFTYHGFRYVRVTGLPLPATAEEKDAVAALFTACALHSAMRPIGQFSCSHPLVNQLMNNIEWGERSNFFDIPTDCPQRDERLGWTGDATIFSETAGLLFDTKLFFAKWLRDVAEETDDEHGVPHIVPSVVGKAVGTAVWSDCATFIPWNLYMAGGDRALLREQYPLMKQWTEYMIRACGEEDLWTNGFQRGDWLALDAPQSRPGLMSGGTDKNLVANIFFAESVRRTACAAEELGYGEDAAAYRSRYERIKKAINREYVTQTGRIVSETQTAAAMLLHYDMIEEQYRERAASILKRTVSDHGGHLTTGFVGTASLLPALSSCGMHDVAAEILMQPDYPGWMYAIQKGATTIWERWDSVHPDGSFDESGMNSLNHYSYGSVGTWLFEDVAGIRPAAPGWKKIRIAPRPTMGLPRVEASAETPYGRASVDSRCENGRYRLRVEVPFNTTAEIVLPGSGERVETGSGVFEYEYDTDLSLTETRFSMQSTIGALLDDPEAGRVLTNVMPELAEESIRAYLRGQTLAHVAQQAPQKAGQIEAMLRKLSESRIQGNT